MAKDIIMKKGNDEITITEDYLEHYKKLGYKTGWEKMLQRKPKRSDKYKTSKRRSNMATHHGKRGSCYCRWNSYR